jgi:hypothetical protein
MFIFIYLLLSVATPLSLLGLFGAKPIVITFTWLIASSLLITSGIAFFGMGGIVALCGVLFLITGVIVALMAIRSYVHERASHTSRQVVDEV